MLMKDKFGKMCKEKMIEELSSLFKGHPNFVITSYMGSSVSDLEKIRKTLKAAAASYVVVKNSMVRVVFNKTRLEEFEPMVDGGIGIAFSGEDIASTCKILVNFSKDHEKFKIKAALVDGKALSADRIKTLASLPSREVLLSTVLGAIKSPITGFVLTLGGIITKFVRVVDAIKESKHDATK